MALGHGAGVVRSGVVLHLDAANPKSYTGSETTLNDLSGNNRNGVLTNGPTFSSNNKGSFMFDGVNDFWNTNYMPPTGTNPRTISVWFNPNALQNRNLLGYGTSANRQMWDILLFNGSVGAHLNGTGAEAGTPFQVGVWQNVVFTFTYPTITSYMNGIQKNSYSSTSINTGTVNNLSISKGVFGTYQYFNGLISNVQIYDRALTPSEIQQNFEVLRGRYGI